MGQLFSDTADMRPPITRQPARLHRAGSVPCKPKTLKMSAYGTFPLLRDPKGLANTVGAAHTRVPATWQGCRENLLHPTTEKSPPTQSRGVATRLLRKP